METSLQNLKKKILKIKKKRPGYKEILEFYFNLKKEQEKIKPSLKIESIKIEKEFKDLLSKEGFPLLEKKDFSIDSESSMTLFNSFLKIGKKANPHMSKEVEKIKEAIKTKKVDIKKLFLENPNEKKIEDIVSGLGLDKKIFLFLFKESLRPSIEEGVRKFSEKVTLETGLKNFCPICGSKPYMAFLKEEVGKRYLLCSYCGYEWRFDRLACPFCENREQASLKYFFEEGEEAYRIDICEKCKQYIKTIDLRKIQLIDPIFEDISTIHLDLLALNKGYNRPTSNPWMP
jgi:FdhE protein